MEELLEDAIDVVESIISLIRWYSLISGNIICDGIIGVGSNGEASVFK